MNKKDIIKGMCLFYDPNYNKLDKTEARNLYNLMERLYNEDLEPYLKHRLNRSNLYGETNASKRRKRKTRP